jgi:hypothetical protein
MHCGNALALRVFENQFVEPTAELVADHGLDAIRLQQGDDCRREPLAGMLWTMSSHSRLASADRSAGAGARSHGMLGTTVRTLLLPLRPLWAMEPVSLG